MIDFSIHQLFPDFLLADKNGYAMAKAIEAGLKYYLTRVQKGLDTLKDVSKMPEWRLDELAWEKDILYDYSADVETKRKWIEDASYLYSLRGTPACIKKYLEAVFDSVNVEEWWQYGGEPFHFRVTVTGEWSQESESWINRAIQYAKNVRSVFDSVTFSADNGTADLKAGAATTGIEVVVTCRML